MMSPLQVKLQIIADNFKKNNMKKIILLLLFLPFYFNSYSQNNILLTVGDKKITKEEFLKMYNKNNSSNLLTEKKSIPDYLGLFIDYKLKVLEAERNKVDTSQAFQKEFNGYLKQLVEPYLIDESLDEKLLKEAYERMKTEVRSSHILIKLKESASPADTLLAYEKAMKIRDRLLKGENFEVVAKSSSDDPSVVTNGGDIGFTSVFGTLYDYENALYTLEIGKISMPVRSSVGYHVIKVTDKRPSKGEFKVSHIMVAFESKDADKKKAKEKIDSVYIKLKAGEDFKTLAAKYSTDKRTSINGGELGWVNASSRFPTNFKEKLFSLSKKGEYTEPFETSYGWHIIKLYDQRGILPFDDLKEELKNRIAGDPVRSKLSKKSVVERLKKEYNYKVNETAFKEMVEKIDTPIIHGNWPFPIQKEFPKAVFSFADQSFDGWDIARWMGRNQSKYKRVNDKEATIKILLDAYSSIKILEYEQSHLAGKNKEFADLVQEYHDGMMLFEITNMEVWSKSNTDTVGLKQYYEENKEKYKWGERAVVSLYYCKDSLISNELVKLLQKKGGKKYTMEYIMGEINKTDKTNVRYETKVYEKGDNESIDKLSWIQGNISKSENNVIIEIVKIIPPEVKKFNEARGILISDYQKYLEETWIKFLRSKYVINVNQELLSTLSEN